MIVHADSYEYLKTMSNQSVNAVITDYVYGTVFPFEELKRVCTGNIITFCSDQDYPFKPDERAYWIKTPSTKNYSRHLGRFVENIFIHRAEHGVFNTGLHWSNYTGVYTDLVEDQAGHQWRKPLSLVERLVKIYTRQGDVVLDPFMGSGVTIEACMRHLRAPIGIDIDIQWVEYAKRIFE